MTATKNDFMTELKMVLTPYDNMPHMRNWTKRQLYFNYKNRVRIYKRVKYDWIHGKHKFIWMKNYDSFNPY